MFPLYDETPHFRTPAFVLLIIAACLGLNLYAYTLPPEKLIHFVREWGLIPSHLRHGAPPETWWTPLTSMFLHGGWAHVAGNCWFLWLFGNNIEDRLGHVRFLLFYAVTVWLPPQRNTPSPRTPTSPWSAPAARFPASWAPTSAFTLVQSS